MSKKPHIAAIGECMLELSGSTNGDPIATPLHLSYGGDTLNTAIYLARLGMQSDYVTMLGDDSHSHWMLSKWQSEGVGCSQVAKLPGRLPGLYMIETDSMGERQFGYWRKEAPARELFNDEQRIIRLENYLAQVDLVYLSGITLSLYDCEARDRLFAMLARLRANGVKVAFDGNYRPRGWTDSRVAKTAFQRAYDIADFRLPTYDDEQALFNDKSPEETLARLTNVSNGEVVLKRGALGCMIWQSGDCSQVDANVVERVTDTTAAGDSFNAGYLAARLSAVTPQDAARQAHALAACVIQHRGAIVPKDAMTVLPH